MKRAFDMSNKYYLLTYLYIKNIQLVKAALRQFPNVLLCGSWPRME